MPDRERQGLPALRTEAYVASGFSRTVTVRLKADPT